MSDQTEIYEDTRDELISTLKDLLIEVTHMDARFAEAPDKLAIIGDLNNATNMVRAALNRVAPDHEETT